MSTKSQSNHIPNRQVLMDNANKANWSPATRVPGEKTTSRDLASQNPSEAHKGNAIKPIDTSDEDFRAAVNDAIAEMLKQYQGPAILGSPVSSTAPDYLIHGALNPQDCYEVRHKINRLLDSDEYNFDELANAIGVSTAALIRFRDQGGPLDEVENDVFVRAWKYFKTREMAGLKPRTKQTVAKKRKATDGDAGTSSKRKARADSTVDVSTIELPGEQDDAVPVYNTCDEIRRKISAHLRKPGITQAQLCRDLHAQLHSRRRTASIQPMQLSRFRGYRGPSAGNTSCVFYAAYVFFEKMRIAEGKPKNKHREDMQQIWPEGFDVEKNVSKYTCLVSQRPYEDQYGRISYR